MNITEKKLDIDFPIFSTEFDIDDCFYFDIETTGFNVEATHLYAIGIAYSCNCEIYYRQWFIENESEEADAIKQFLHFINSRKVIIHFNGSTFDLPYIQKKCKKYAIKEDLRCLKSIDLYKKLFSHKKYLSLDSFKQRNIEISLGISRDDTFNGKELITIYHAYQSMSRINSESAKNESRKIYDFLFLHNYEDVSNLVLISHVLYLEYILLENSSKIITRNPEDITIDIKIDCPIMYLPIINKYITLLDFSTVNTCMEYIDGYIRIKVKVFDIELKYFMEDYKNYYYLPAEDYAIHKSVGEYVDSAHRQKAKKNNCYVKKKGKFVKIFAPEFTSGQFRFFSENVNDNIKYIDIDDFIDNSESSDEFVKAFTEMLRLIFFE